MKRIANHPPRDLFSDAASSATETLGPGATILRGFVRGQESALLGEVAKIVALSPFRHLVTPGGFRMSVAMTNCGEVGWVSDRTGYRYDPMDPETRRPWPALPDAFLGLALTAAARAGFDHFVPDACLINRYEPGTKLSLHRDYDERDVAAPIVSVSIGVPATFQWGGLKRNDRTRRVRLESGDVVVWGGESRFVYHGIAALAEGDHPATGPLRINLTFRKAR
ncbi:alkylated DNA repair protein (DNA oxidative demethylase) [Povalibacter uvarum]|uniref:Alkylated DNA repair protein (DNA oxidative demethylase) n=1 Tax=Povalibacter uvarum TaxID=732238 RepID=A0A841HRC1_9GAMM|nr:DNA oxidative demethylase AlkB [Povalibacter uvarum]MBB6095313.1 alkylated DNA repair protein (DNA oxidative demethylase) [Povalibacter uvarum]